MQESTCLCWCKSTEGALNARQKPKKEKQCAKNVQETIWYAKGAKLLCAKVASLHFNRPKVYIRQLQVYNIVNVIV